MAVQSDTSSITYTGNNSTVTTYAVPFVFLENSHLAATAKVTATGVESVVTLTNHTGAGDANGGTVRTAVAVPATSTLTIYRVVPATQTTTYQEGGDFPAASHEKALDKLTMLGQQNARKNDRSIRVTEADGNRNEMVAVANTLVGLDANKQPKAMTASEVKTLLALSGVTLDVDAGMKTFADAGERALAVPDFTGQLGTQRDTADIYISTGTVAGNWSLVDENMSLADFAAGFFTANATGRGKFESGFVDATLIASDAVTTAKILNAAVTNAKLASDIDASKLTSGTLPIARIADSAVTPAKLSQPFTLATSVAATSGTSIDFTSIPTWAKRIIVLFAGTSTNGSANYRIQVGVGGTAITSGYVSGYYSVTNSVAVSVTNATAGFEFVTASASSVFQGHLILEKVSSSQWLASGVLYDNNSVVRMAHCTGRVTGLSGDVDMIRVTTSNGVDTFDSGEINIMYEG